MFETIVALATAPIKSALAIVRLSGDDVLDVVSKCCTKDLRNIKERTILYASIVDKGEKIDDVVLLVYKGPKSFTGEDSVEIIWCVCKTEREWPRMANSLAALSCIIKSTLFKQKQLMM